ncbi:MAG: hypothetical protein ABW197_05785 [Methyloceanibacter sp.]
MTWCDERLGFGSTPAPCDEDVQARLKALSPEELVPAWREASTTSLRDRTDGTYAVSMYFDRLGHDEPERAVSFIDALLAQELALRQPRLRWLMGGATWSISGGMVEDEDTKRRLLAIADKDAFEAWEETYRGRETPDFAALSRRACAALG